MTPNSHHSNQAQGVRWARGTFRLWVLLSAVWVAAVGALSYSGITKPYYRGIIYHVQDERVVTYHPFSPEAYRLENEHSAGKVRKIPFNEVPASTIYVDVGGKRDRVVTDYLFAPEPSVINDEQWRKRIENTKILAAKQYNDAVSASRISAIKSASTLAAVPPLVLLMFGGGVAWAIKGFRTT